MKDASMADSKTAIKAARVLTSSDAELIQDGVVVVSGEEILDVGSWEALRHGLGEAKVRELGDVTLMPGLFDCHVHLCLDPAGFNTTKVEDSDEDLLKRMSDNALRLLDAGITTARDLGCPGTLSISIRDKILRHEIPGPRMQCANAPLTVPGGHAHSMGGECQGVEGCRAEVRKRKAEGADLVKVMATGGFMTAGTRPMVARFSQEEMDAMADEAHKCGMSITTHAIGTEGIERAARAKFDSIEHCSWLAPDGKTRYDERVGQIMIDNGVRVCPTMNTACTHENYFCPWDERKAIVDNLSAMRSAGHKLLVGTDAGISYCRFERYCDGLLVLGDAGYSSRQIIQGATENPAEICGLANKTGKLVKGFTADLAAFEGNPLENLGAFSKPKFVMARGEEHKLTPIADLPDLTGIKEMVAQKLTEGAGLRQPAVAAN